MNSVMKARSRRWPVVLLTLCLLVVCAMRLSQPAASASADSGFQPAGRNLTLWYDKPAQAWEAEALPIGSGALGAKIFGGVDQEQLQVNEKTLWTGGPGSAGYNYGNWNSPRPTAIQEVQDLIVKDAKVSPTFAAGKLGQGRVGFGAYQSMGDLKLTAPSSVAATSYRRWLDISDATSGVGFVADGVTYSREYFASAADHVIVGRLSADQSGKVSTKVALSAPSNRSNAVTAANGRILMMGKLNDNGLRYASAVQVIADGGTLTSNSDGTVTVTGANSVVFVMTAATDYASTYPAYRSGVAPETTVASTLASAQGRTYADLRLRHTGDYRSLFNRVGLNLGQAMPAITTDALLGQYKNGTASASAQRALEALFFQYGRYLLIASSRSGSLPANLQGVWNNSEAPPWAADYHTNINLEMNYWPAEATNLTEVTTPLFDFVDALVKPGEQTARSQYGNRGWVVHNETNPFGYTGVHNYPTSFWMPEAGAWLARHYFEHYEFTQDAAFLRERAYPLMKALALFWFDELVTDPRDNKLVVSPTISPEHGDFTAGAAMSQQIVWDLLTNTLKASGVVGETDAAFVTDLKAKLSQLDPGTRVGSWGQLQEWKADLDSETDDHRHASHLFALHPGTQIDPRTNTRLADAARVSLKARGDGGTGWSKAWKVNFWARLLDGNHAYLMLSEQLKQSTLKNLWDTHPPFQIDGNFGATSGVAEMLLQSQQGVVDVLPALPDTWAASGTFNGLRARGDLTVAARWLDRKATRIEITAGHSGVIKLRSSLSDPQQLVLDTSTSTGVAATSTGGVLTFTGTAGHTYVLDSALCPNPATTSALVAWDTGAGGTSVADASRYARTATITGTSGPDTSAPSGTGLALGGSAYLRTAATKLGFLPEATLAAELKLSQGSTYRRLFDIQPSGNSGTDGVLVDITPSNNVRVIGSSGLAVTTATVPSQRWFDLVVTVTDNGAVAVYIDGKPAGTGTLPANGIASCAMRELRFGADQLGGQRFTGSVDRLAILPFLLGPGEVSTWKTRAFG